MGKTSTYSGLKHHFGDTIGGLRTLIKNGTFSREDGIKYGNEFIGRLEPFLERVSRGERPIEKGITLEKLQALSSSMKKKDFSSVRDIEDAYNEVYILLGETPGGFR